MSTTSKPSRSNVCRTSCHNSATQPLPSACLCLLSQIMSGYGRALGGDKASGMHDAHGPSIPPQCSVGHFILPPHTALVPPGPTSPSNSFKAPYLPLLFSGSPAPYCIYRSSTCPAAGVQLSWLKLASTHAVQKQAVGRTNPDWWHASAFHIQAYQPTQVWNRFIPLSSWPWATKIWVNSACLLLLPLLPYD